MRQAQALVRRHDAAIKAGLAPGMAGLARRRRRSTRNSSASWSQSTRMSTTCCTCPEVSPLRQSSLRERDRIVRHARRERLLERQRRSCRPASGFRRSRLPWSRRRSGRAASNFRCEGVAFFKEFLVGRGRREGHRVLLVLNIERRPSSRHCERSEAIHACGLGAFWIASLRSQ